MTYILAKDQLPPVDKDVLACTEEGVYFIGHYSGRNDNEYDIPLWFVNVDCLNCDTYRNDAFGEVIKWMEIPQ